MDFGDDSEAKLITNAAVRLSITYVRVPSPARVVKERCGETVLHWVAKNGHKTVVQPLLEKGADIAAKGECGFAALHWVAESGDVAVVRQLLKEGADAAAEDKEGQTALHWAAGSGHEAVVRLLLDKRPDVTARDKSGLMTLAVRNRHGTVLRRRERTRRRKVTKGGRRCTGRQGVGMTLLCPCCSTTKPTS